MVFLPSMRYGSFRELTSNQPCPAAPSASHRVPITVPIRMLTSRAGEKHRQKAIEMGAQDYLVKPFEEQEMLEAWMQWLCVSPEAGREIVACQRVESVLGHGLPEGQEFAAQVMEFVRYHAMKTSIEMAEERGFRVLHGIVDSLWLEGKGDKDAFCAQVSAEIGIPLQLEGVYRWIVFLASRQDPQRQPDIISF